MARDGAGRTVLHWAVLSGEVTITCYLMQLLVGNGFVVWVYTCYRLAVLWFAATLMWIGGRGAVFSLRVMYNGGPLLLDSEL